MKTLFGIGMGLVFCASAAFADFSERKLESTKRSAERTAKLIAFIFYDDIVASKDSNDVNGAGGKNNAAKRAVPRADAVIIEINKSDKELDKLPECVKKDGVLPRVVITDSKCEEVIAQYDGAPSREKVKEVEAKVAEATKFLEKKK
jgi:acyl-CoA hydrolase